MIEQYAIQYPSKAGWKRGVYLLVSTHFCPGFLNNSFEIKILDLQWIEGIDEPSDICAHGHLYLKIGDQVLSNKDNNSWTLSSTALYLLRTLNRDYHTGDFGSQLVPHCGHFMILDEQTKKVIIMGCPNGLGWEIAHNGNKIKHITETGQSATLDAAEYKKIVFDFADQVEQFYKNSSPKAIPQDESDKNAYLAFWEEWYALRSN